MATLVNYTCKCLIKLIPESRKFRASVSFFSPPPPPIFSKSKRPFQKTGRRLLERDVPTGYLPISCQPTSLSTFLPTYLPNFQATCALLHIYLNTYHTYLPNSTRCTYLPSLIDSSRSAWWRPSSPAWWLLLSISVSNPKHQYANLSRRKVWLCSLLVKGNCWPPMEIWYHDQSSFHYVGICGHQYTSAFGKFLLTSWSFPSKSNTTYWVCAYSYKAFFL